MILLKTIHGSRLYGTDNENSDYDFYTVSLDKSKTRQTIVNKEDELDVSLDSFLSYINKGVPQSLEALFSAKKEISHPLMESIRPSTGSVISTYMRTIKDFTFNTDLKRQRHSVRMCFNLSDFLEFGYFNPTLSPSQLDMALIPATMEHDELVRYLIDNALSYDLHDEFLMRMN